MIWLIDKFEGHVVALTLTQYCSLRKSQYRNTLVRTDAAEAFAAAAAIRARREGRA